jgi:cytochrome c553
VAHPSNRLAQAVVIGFVFVATVDHAASQRGMDDRQVVPLDVQRTAQMQGHYAHVLQVHEAVIRGDLAAVKGPATWLAEHGGPVALPAAAAPYEATLRAAAQRAADAPTVLAAAIATAQMLRTCGDCHRAVGTMPAMADAPRQTGLGGVVGHMLAHQQAADTMVQGLVAPSDRLWRAGAEGLKGAPLHPSALPRDSRMSRELWASEERIHQLASQAVRTDDRGARAVFYAQILGRCADCHALHRKIWGPSAR